MGEITAPRGLRSRIAALRRGPQAAGHAEGEVVELRSTSVGDVQARRASLTRSAARSIHAEQDVTLALSAAQRISAGGDAIITGGAAALLSAGGDVRVDGGSAALLVSGSAHVEGGTIGLLLARDAQLGGGSRVLIQAREALILGAAIGVLAPLLSYLLRRLLPPPPAREERADRPWYQRLGLWAAGVLLRLGVTALVGWLAYRALRQRVERLLPFLFHR